MQRAGEKITLDTLQKRLEQRGVHVPRGAVHLSSMWLWLAKAGVFDENVKSGPGHYQFDESRVQSLLGVRLDVVDSLAQLTAGQRAFLRALTRLPGPDPVVANEVADLATTLYGVEYNHKQLPKSVLFHLRDLGYVALARSTVGHGAKPYRLTRTPKFRQEINGPLLDLVAQKTGVLSRELLERPLSDILADLRSPDKNTKGIALELLTIYLTRLLDLDFKGWRTRGLETGGAEVDVIVEGARLIFSRWQIQAKNTRTVDLGDVAKEVGLALPFIRSNVIMVVTTGSFTQDACTYASEVMRSTNLHIILLAGSDLRKIAQDPAQIVSILNSKAGQAMKIKERTDYFLKA
jgi:hypothetical protein